MIFYACLMAMHAGVLRAIYVFEEFSFRFKTLIAHSFTIIMFQVMLYACGQQLAIQEVYYIQLMKTQFNFIDFNFNMLIPTYP